MKLIKYAATWCQPCKSLAPVLDKVLADFPSIELVNVDIEQEPTRAAAAGVRSVPTLEMDGQTLAGGITEASLRQWLNSRLDAADAAA